MTSARRKVVEPASRAIAPSCGSRNSRAAWAIRTFSTVCSDSRTESAGLEAEGVGDDGPAMHPAQQPGPLQDGEVAAHGLRGDLEAGGELGDVDATRGACAAGDRGLPLFRIHPTLVYVSVR